MMDEHQPVERGPRPITELTHRLGISRSLWIPYGRDIAKVEPALLDRPRRRPGTARLILVSAITPTAAGEGKTTTSIGLAQGLAHLGESSCLSLREPSLGPVMGKKGGATGGGRSQLVPAQRINLHFTGDLHAVGTAHNLLAAMLDNHLHFDSPLRIDPRRVLWQRVIDMNDRSLRHLVIGLGGVNEGVPRETGFDITAASEVMAMLCLAEDAADLRGRLDRTLVAFDFDRRPVTAAEVGATGAMMALLVDALKPNLVQTGEGVPAFVHGGPFANIAHGCSSVLATRMAMHVSDWAITEAGFGFDLGAEKFYDIKAVDAGLDTAAVVLVATVRALKLHGGREPDDLAVTDPAAVAAGLPNLEKHIENIRLFREVPVVALNRFESDDGAEIDVVRRRCAELGVPFAVADHFARGGEGAVELARGRQDPGRGAQDVRGQRGRLHQQGPTRPGRGRAARLRRAPRLHRQDAELALRRPQPPRPADRLRGHRARRPHQRRGRLPGGADGRHRAHAGPAPPPRRRAHRRARRRDRGLVGGGSLEQEPGNRKQETGDRTLASDDECDRARPHP
jgi:formate--tetrahydrofolate ligase